MRRKKFPVLGVIILLYGIVWFLSEMGIIRMDVPWIPMILIIIGTGMIFNRLAA